MTNGDGRLGAETAGTGATAQVDFKRIVSRAMASVPGIIACGVVDLDQGDWVALESIGRHPEDFLAYLAMQAREMFEGDAVHTIQAVLKSASRDPGAGRRIDEVVMRSGGVVHLLVRWEADPNRILAVVATRGTRLGLILSSLRATLGVPIAPGL